MTDSKSTEKRHLAPDTLAASVTILLVANVIQRSIGFGRGILFCRWLTPDELGTWEMAYSFLLLAAPVIVLGLPGSFGRYLERYRQRGQLRTFLRRTTQWSLALTFVACAADHFRGAALFKSHFRPPRCNDTCYCIGAESRRRYFPSLLGSVIFCTSKIQHCFDNALLPKHFVRDHFARALVVVAFRCRKHRHRLRRSVPGVGHRHFVMERRRTARRSRAR